MSHRATAHSQAKMIVGDVNQFSDANEVVSDVWPVAKNYFYVELRNNKQMIPSAIRN